MSPNLYEIEIFKAGTRPASNGVMTTISPQDLQQIVDTYNPEYFRAPLIVSESVGHDIGNYTDKTASKSKELCHGIPKRLRRVGDRLIAGFDKISHNFADWVRNKQIHSVSSSFYLPDSPNNPYPGKWSLRHIAGLGTTPPACKGLAPLPEPPVEWGEKAEGRRQRAVFTPCLVSFNEEEEGVLDFGGTAIMSSPWAIAADLFQRYREYLIESEDLETADRVLPADQIATLRSMAEVDNAKQMQIYDLQNQIAQMRMGDSDYDYGEGMNYQKAMKDAGMSVADVSGATGISEDDLEAIASGTKQPSAKQKKLLAQTLSMEDDSTDMSEELERREADLKAREEAIANREHALEYQEVASFVEGLVKSGKLASGRKQDTITLLLNTPNSQEVEFSETVGRKTPRQALMDDYNSRQTWNYSEDIVTPESAPKSADFAAPKGYAVDQGSMAIYRRAIAYCEAKNLNPNDYNEWNQAIEAVSETNGHG